MRHRCGGDQKLRRPRSSRQRTAAIGRRATGHPLHQYVFIAKSSRTSQTGRNAGGSSAAGTGEQELAAINTIEIAEAERWNSLVLTLPGCDLRQGFEWGELQRDSGWMPHRFAVVHGDCCIAAIQLLAKKLRRLGEFVLYAPRGPRLDWGDGSAWPGLLEAVNRVAAQTGAVFLRASPGVEATDGEARAALLRNGFIQLGDDRTSWNMPRIIQTLDL